MKSPKVKLALASFFLFVFIYGEGKLFAQARLVIGNASPVYININGGTAGTHIYLVVGNSATNAVGYSDAAARQSWIISEGQYNYMKWACGTVTGNYIFPFGYSTTAALPLTFNKTSAGSSNVMASTWGSNSSNVPWATASDLGSVAAVTNMYSSALGQDGSDEAVIDRWWDIYADGGATANITFSYRGAENTMSTAPTGILGVQHWDGTDWNDGKGGSNGSQVTTGQNGVTSGVGTATANSLTEFTPYILIATSAPLPVTWLDFSTECIRDELYVKWSTASEQNADYFTVERSANGTDFDPIATLPAAGNSNTTKKYAVVDTDPLQGLSYYRVRETDFNGDSYLTSQITSEECEEDMVISVFPNPTTGSEGMNITIVGAVDTEVLIVVTDMLGRDFYSKVTLVTSDTEIIAIDPANQLAAGVYTVVASSKDDIQKKKIVVQ